MIDVGGSQANLGVDISGLNAEIRQLRDQYEIARVISRYAHAFDERDWDAWATCFTDDVDVTVRAVGLRCRGLDNYRAECEGAIADIVVMQHNLHTAVIDIDGDQARAQFYGHCVHEMVDGSLVSVGARYVTELRRVDSTWRISVFDVSARYSDGQIGAMTSPEST